MTKNVKITVTGMPITCISAPLTRGTHGPVVLALEDIFKCLVAGASVREILSNGSEIVLNLANYSKDNTVESNSEKADEDVVEDFSVAGDVWGEPVHIAGSPVGADQIIPDGAVVVDESKTDDESTVEETDGNAEEVKDADESTAEETNDVTKEVKDADESTAEETNDVTKEVEEKATEAAPVVVSNQANKANTYSSKSKNHK